MELDNNWKEDSADNLNFYNCDCIYKRRILKLGRHFSLIESIRVTRRNIGEHISVHYNRHVGMSESKMWDMKLTGRIYNLMYRVYNFILSSYISDVVYDDIRDSKLYKKYPFIGDSFKDVVRDRKLEELGI